MKKKKVKEPELFDTVVSATLNHRELDAVVERSRNAAIEKKESLKELSIMLRNEVLNKKQNG
jgi:hypothetical protein